MTAVPTITVSSLNTLTISGSDAGTTNTVYAARWEEMERIGSWSSVGSRSGDGTVDMGLAPGYWWIHVTSDDTSDIVVSLPYYYAISNY